MTAPNNTAAADGDLQFDRVAPSVPSVTCAKCSRTITTYYYTVDDASYCSTCKRTIDAEWANRKTGLWRAAGYGFGAALAGAAIYYGVIAITNLEIGIVALLIGYMVGHAVRSGAGRGGRRFQVLAAALVYLSVGMAYSPLALKPILNGKAASSLLMKAQGVSKAPRKAPQPAPVAVTSTDQKADSTGSSASAPVSPTVVKRPATSARRRITTRLVVVASLSLAMFVAVLPIVAIIGSLPAGLISALIIGIGMRRAWRMTADTGDAGPGVMVIAGPFRVGKPATVATA
jgi:hypothetical protein